MQTELLYKCFRECNGVSTDTRQITKDVMFVALKGANFNGNLFAEEALNKGARYVVIDEAQYKKDERYLLVEDGLTALQALAQFRRNQLKIPFIAITGSNGKTTTKELLNAVLSKKYKTYATKGNLNNHIGIPLTILAIPDETEMAIIEMGANHQKEIEGYCEIAAPTHGLITNIGKAHLEGFGGFEGVKKGKGELFAYLKANSGVVFVNTLSTHIMEMAAGISTAVKYGSAGDTYAAKLLQADPFIRFVAENGEEVTTKLIGEYNFENISAALCVGKYFNVEAKAANAAIAEYDPQNNRSQVVQYGTARVVLDAYNANPSSMKAAIENFAKLPYEEKWVILGDMFELGDEALSEHKALGVLLAGIPFTKIILCGKNMSAAAEACRSALYFADKAALESWFKTATLGSATILLKGSRGMKLESILEEKK